MPVTDPTGRLPPVGASTESTIIQHAIRPKFFSNRPQSTSNRVFCIIHGYRKLATRDTRGKSVGCHPNPENCASEIPQRLANSRECRAYFCEPDITCRDGTGWLGRQDSNLCIPDRGSPRLSARGCRIRTGASRLKVVVAARQTKVPG